MEKYQSSTNQQLKNALFHKAVAFAVEKHSGQVRKGSPWPYIVHIYDVAQILQENGATAETVIAGVLHDTVEDTGTTIWEIAKKFGDNVANYVNFLSENKNLSYMERKMLQIQRIKNAPIAVKMVKCADCLSNLRATYLDEKIGDDVWRIFHSTKQNIAEHYALLIGVMMPELDGTKMFEEVTQFYSLLFGDQSLANNQSKNKTKEQKTTNKQGITDCTKCNYMKRETTPYPDDWFEDDNEQYFCKKLKRVLSVMNRPYESQPTPDDCPLNEE